MATVTSVTISCLSGVAVSQSHFLRLSISLWLPFVSLFSLSLSLSLTQSLSLSLHSSSHNLPQSPLLHSRTPSLSVCLSLFICSFSHSYFFIFYTKNYSLFASVISPEISQ